MKARLLMIKLFLIFILQTFAQSNSGGLLSSNSQQNAIDVYKNALQEESGLYNGPAYVDYLIKISENSNSPYLGDSLKMSNGSVVYDGVLYQNILLLYDVFKKMLITISPSTNLRFSLVNDRIDSFTVLGYNFKSIKLGNIKTPKNFYDVLFSGEKSRAYQLHLKEANEDLSGRVSKIRLSDKNLFFIEKDGRITQVKKRKHALRIFSDHRSEVSHFLRKEKLRFKNDVRRDLVELTKFYDGL